MLIVPCPQVASVSTNSENREVANHNPNSTPHLRDFTHFQSFLQTAESTQVLQLLQRATSELLSYMKSHPKQRVWWSTSGLGVYYLHIRLDPRPKYYNWIPYKA